MKKKYLLFIAIFIAIAIICLTGKVQAYQSDKSYVQMEFDENYDVIRYEYDSASKLYYKVKSGNVHITGVAEGITDINIPSKIKGTNVTTIENYAFKPYEEGKTTIKTVTIPDTITYIGGYSFQDCMKLVSVKMPNKLEWLGTSAFENCKSLKSIEVPAKELGSFVFYGCTNLEKIVFTGITEFTSAYWIFDEDCINLKEIYMPNTVINIKITQLDKNIIGNATIYCAKGSKVEQYCKENRIKYSALEIPFFDVKTSDWYYGPIKYVYQNNIILGTSANKFSPSNKLNRGQLAVMLWRMDGSKKVTSGKNFPDVKSGEYYYEAVKWASANGIVSGYKTGKFGPADNITREQLAVMLNNYAKYKKKNVSKLADISRYKDVKGVSSYAVEAVRWAIQNKIISGKENGTKIDPKGNASRAEAATMIQNYCIYVK